MLPDFYSSTLVDLFFEQTDDFVGIYDLQAERFVRVNQAGFRMLGYTSEQSLLSDSVRSRSIRAQPLEPHQRSGLIERIIEVGQHRETTQIERKDGQLFWGQLVVNSFTTQDHSYALVRLIDQGRLHYTERELAHSNRRYEAIFTSATIGIIVCDQRGQIIAANQLANQLFGYATDGLLTLTIEQLVPTGVSKYHEKLRQTFNAVPQTRPMGHNRDLQAKRKDGSVFPVEISLSYFQLEDELFVVAYIIDITLKKQAERDLLAHRDHIEQLNADLEQKVADRTHALMETLKQLEQSKNELAKALVAERELGELKSRFVSMASHEFRTPLTTVLNAATLIEKYPGNDQQEKRQKHLHRIREAVKHLNDILEEFLSLGKLEEGKIEAHPVEVDIDRMVGETVADMQSMLKPEQTIQMNLSCSEPVWLDSSLLRKILVNLLSNAVKYSGPGSVVMVGGNCANGDLKLSVTDQGVGISPDDQLHLFERFFRAKSVMNIAGTGLGLHIVGRYVELMGGKVTLTSVLNEGTTVTINIPYENYPPD